MKVSYQALKDLIPGLEWSAAETADKLSMIGHETEVQADQLDVTLTANRHDCKDIKYLAFDLAGVYNLKTVDNLISFSHEPLITLATARVNQLLGSNICDQDLKQLERLGFIVSTTGVQPPDFRDVRTDADIAEEIFRIIGPTALAIEPLTKKEASASPRYQHLLAVKITLANLGLTETATSSFVEKGSVELKNPFSKEEPFLRPSLQTGLLRTLSKNPYLKRAAFFEIGDVFEPKEITKLGLILAGYKNWSDWQAKISAELGQAIHFTPVNPLQAEQTDTRQGQLYFAEVPVEALKPTGNAQIDSINRPLPKFRSISKYPPLVRDVTIDESRVALIETIRQAPDLLLAEPIDRYQCNLTYRLIFQKMDSSFTDSEVKRIDEQIETHFFKS